MKRAGKRIGTILLAIVLVTTMFVPYEAQGAGTVSLTADFAIPGNPIESSFSDQSIWTRGPWDCDQADALSDNAMKERFPHLVYEELYMATGGYPSIDLLVNPNDYNSAYKFDSLVNACRNILRQGLKPVIKTGSVPWVFSSQPQSGDFGANVRKPADYYKYSSTNSSDMRFQRVWHPV